MKTYRVEPFFPNVTSKELSKEGAGAIARQMEQAINRFAEQGWFYEGYEAVPTMVNAGCLGFGAKTQEVHHMLIFAKIV